MLKEIKKIIILLMSFILFPYIGYLMFIYAEKLMPYYVLIFIFLWYGETWLKIVKKNKKYKNAKNKENI